MPSPPERLLFEYQDNSVSVLLAHGSRVFLAGDAEKKAEEYMANGSYAGPLAIRPTGHFRGFETIKQPDLRFRVLLTEGGSELKLARAQRKEARRGPPQPPHQGSLALQLRPDAEEAGRKSP